MPENRRGQWSQWRDKKNEKNTLLTKIYKGLEIVEGYGRLRPEDPRQI